MRGAAELKSDVAWRGRTRSYQNEDWLSARRREDRQNGDWRI